MNGSESGGIFRPSMPPVNLGVTGVYSVTTDVTSSCGGGSVGFRQNININEHGTGEIPMKKRGRPRKYDPNRSMSPPAASAPVVAKLTPVSSLNGGFEQQPPHSAAVPPISVAPVSSIPMDEGFGLVKKMRGRPPGSLNKKHKEEYVLNKKHKEEYVGLAGFGYTPHILVVQPGEDVLNKIMSFSQNGPNAVCIMSGIGVVNNVTLRQAVTSGGTATYEGRFDILSLSGSFVPTEAFGQRTRTGGLSITLCGSGGRVFGGVVAGLLTAACPVQVIVGSFLPENCKEPLWANHVELSSVTPKTIPANHGTGPSSPLSHGTQSESSGGSGSPLNRGNESRSQDMAIMPWK